MLRAVAGVILGYLVMAILVFGSFSVAYLAMGSERAMMPGSYEVTALWIMVSIVLSLGAAIIGGITCAAVSRGGKAPLYLVGLVLVLGLSMALPALKTSRNAEAMVRAGSVGNFEAMKNAHQPDWLTLANPFLGALGVLVGARLRRSGNPDRA